MLEEYLVLEFVIDWICGGEKKGELEIFSLGNRRDDC